MHSLGFYHEHARSDRDLYIKIVEKNVRPGIVLPQTLGQSSLARWRGGFHFKFQDKNPMQPFSGKFANFRTMRDGETARNFDYDYNSIMHYGPYFFRLIFYPEKKHLKIAFFFPARTSAIEWQRLFPRRQELTLDKGNLKRINYSKKTKTQKNTKRQKKYKNTKKH